MSHDRSVTLEGISLCGWQESLGDMEKTHLPVRIVVPWML